MCALPDFRLAEIFFLNLVEDRQSKYLNINIHTLAKRGKIAESLIGKDYDAGFYIQQELIKAKELIPRALLY